MEGEEDETNFAPFMLMSSRVCKIKRRLSTIK